MDKSRQEIIDHHVLVMKTDELLNLLEFHFVIFFHEAIVKTQEKSLELRHDAVLIVARVADERTAGLGMVARQVPRVRVAARKPIPEEKQGEAFVVVEFVQVRLIVGSAPIKIIQIERGPPKVQKRVGIILLLQAAGRIKRDVKIDELAKIGI